MTRDQIRELLQRASYVQQRTGKTTTRDSFTCNTLLITNEQIVDKEMVEIASELFNAADELLEWVNGYYTGLGQDDPTLTLPSKTAKRKEQGNLKR